MVWSGDPFYLDPDRAAVLVAGLSQWTEPHSTVPTCEI